MKEARSARAAQYFRVVALMRIFLRLRPFFCLLTARGKRKGAAASRSLVRRWPSLGYCGGGGA